MPIPTFSKLGPDPSFGDIVTKVNVLTAELSNLMLNLDSLNVVSLTADHIDAGTIDASVVTIRSDLTAGAYVQIDGNGMVINNGSFNTFTADTNGAVTMTSALIQSGTGAYPRVVMDPDNELFAAYASASEFIKVFASDTGVPSLYFENASNTARIKMAGSLFSIGAFSSLSLASTGNMEISTTNAGTDITLSPADKVIVPSWSTLFSTGATETLQQALDAKATAGASTSTVGTHNHGIASGTVLMVDGGGTVTFVASGSHSHTQT